VQGRPVLAPFRCGRVLCGPVVTSVSSTDRSGGNAPEPQLPSITVRPPRNKIWPLKVPELSARRRGQILSQFDHRLQQLAVGPPREPGGLNQSVEKAKTPLARTSAPLCQANSHLSFILQVTFPGQEARALHPLQQRSQRARVQE